MVALFTPSFIGNVKGLGRDVDAEASLTCMAAITRCRVLASPLTCRQESRSSGSHIRVRKHGEGGIKAPVFLASRIVVKPLSRVQPGSNVGQGCVFRARFQYDRHVIAKGSLRFKL